MSIPSERSCVVVDRKNLRHLTSVRLTCELPLLFTIQVVSFGKRNAGMKTWWWNEGGTLQQEEAGNK